MNRELNLIPQVRSNVKNKKNNKSMIIVSSLVALLIVGASFGISIGGKFYLENKLESLEIELNKSKKKTEEKNNLNDQIAITTKQIEKANLLRQVKSNDTDALLRKMRDAIMVDNIVITRMDYWGKNIEKHDNSVTVEGISPSKEALMKAWANLRELDGFEEAQLEKFDIKESGYEYKMTISFEEGDESEAK